MDNFERVLDNTNSHQLLAVVAAVHHERADETLDDGAQSLAEAFDLVTTSSMWQIFSCFTFDWYVILQGDILDADFIAVPLAEQLDLVGVDLVGHGYSSFLHIY